MVNHRTRDIPWLRVSQFHREIVTRDEESFFSLNGRNDQDKRWTSLNDFDLDEFAGPWYINPDQIQSKKFLETLEQDLPESVYLGGPCYVASQKSANNTFESHWQVLMYIEVELRKGEDSIELSPKQGVWNISPLIESLIDRLEVSASESVTKLTSLIMENAMGLRSSDLPLNRAVWRALETEIPEVVQELRRSHKPNAFPVKPSPWVLFKPTTTFSALTQSLISDYNELEKLLSEDPKNRGGLRILEELPKSVPDGDVDLLPLVQLNNSQERAVKAVLQGYPLTVISGPPGTGKSQVVVSLLLNAWARGQSVLLASNNNKAVDVVRERLEQFESDFPIAVRAGSRKRQNIQETLRHILTWASKVRRTYDKEMDPQNIQQERQELIQEISFIEEQLKSDLPQRIDEACKAALDIYGESQSIIGKIDAQEKQYRSDLESIGILNRRAEMIQNDLASTHSWLDRIEVFRQLVQQEEQRYRNVEYRIEEKLRSIEETAEGLGFDLTNPPDNWDWLVTGPQPEGIHEWEEWALTTLTQVEGDVLQPLAWEEIYGRWANAKEAEKHASDYRLFGQQAYETRLELEPRIATLDKTDHALKKAFDDLQQAGGNSDINASPELLEQWSVSFGEYVTLDNRRLDSAPWSRRSRLQKALQNLEHQLRPGFPLNIWMMIGPLDDDGRKKLATLIERTRQWYQRRQEWELAQPLAEEVDGIIQGLTQRSVALKIDSKRIGRNIELWEQVEVFCAKEAEQGDRAAKYWHHTTAKQQAEASLILLATEWSRLASNNPFSEAWRNTTGSKFDRLISRLSANPSMRTASAVKSVLIDGVLRTMTDPWLEAKKLQEIVVILREEAQSIPTSGELLGRWWNERPVEALVLDSVPGDWSEIPDTFEVLNRLSDWLNQWNDLVDAERPAAEQEAQLLRDRTISRLELAANLLPDPNNQIHAIDIIRKLENDPYSEWPITEISKSILRFGAERMRAQASGLQAKIKVSTFKMAKSAWIERLRTDDEAVRSVDRLETMLTRNFGRLPAGNTQVFRAALRIAPIWITTAQAPQAVPLEPDLFDIVVIDEASQCTVTNLLPLLYRGKSLVVIGDDQQLPSITTVNEAEEMSLARKYRVEDFLYLIGHDKNDVYRAAVNSLPGRRGDVSMLVEHYRSHPQIIGFSNRYIYNQQLELKKDPNRIKQSTIAGGIHKRSVQGVARKGNNGQSWVNEPEADMVIRLIHEIKAGDSRSLSLGVVTPFAAHKKYLLDKLKNADFASDVLIDSAYGFQGDEKDIIIFSPVVASGITPLASRWVEEPPNLINVAITRARESVFVVADFNYCLSQNGLLRKLALYCNDIQTLRDTSQAELELYSWMILKGINPKVHPRIGDIEVDFSLKSTSGQNLVVEVDGKQHLNAIEGDKVRDAFLSTQGYSVLRFPVRDVFETPIAVLHTIQEHLNN